MTKQVEHNTPRNAGHAFSLGATVLVGWTFLACASAAAGQPAADTAAKLARPPAQVSGSEQQLVAPVAELLRFELGANFEAGIPVGAFGDKVGVSPGAGVDFTVRLGQTPVFVGTAFDYLRYGTETRRLSVLPAVPEVLSDVNTTNNLVRTHALVRVRPSTGRVRPYAEGLLGFAYVNTTTSVDLGENGDAGTTHLGDFAPSFGAGGGVTIELLSRDGGRLGLDIGLRYVTSGEVDYLAPGELQRAGSGVTFEPSRSRAALLGVQIGIAVDF